MDGQYVDNRQVPIPELVSEYKLHLILNIGMIAFRLFGLALLVVCDYVVCEAEREGSLVSRAGDT